LQRKARVKLDFVAPKAVGPSTLTLFFMCDSYMGCDQEFELELDVKEGAASEDEEAPQQMDQD
jgi:pre-mRNA-splicing helicase BRR2